MDSSSTLVGDGSSSHGSMDSHFPEASRNVAPYEALTSRAVTAAILVFSKHNPADQPALDYLPSFRTTSLTMALVQAANALRFNAKWFSSQALADVICATFDTVQASASSAELDAALLLINTIATYSLLPIESLPKATRVLAYIYHQGNRSNRSKKLADEAWAVALHVFQSHLGSQLLETFLGVLADFAFTNLRKGFATVHGALAITTRLYFSNEPHLPGLDLHLWLSSLREIAGAPEDVLREDVILILSRILADESMMTRLEVDAEWDTLVFTAEQCIRHLPETDQTASLFLDALVRWLPHFEARSMYIVAKLCLRFDKPLTKSLECALIETMLRPLVEDVPSSSQELITILEMSANCPSSSELMGITAEKILDVLLHTTGAAAGLDLKLFISALCRLVRDSAKTSALPYHLSMAMVRVFEDSTSSIVDATRYTLLYHSLCSIASCNAGVANVLFRIRADAAGELYFQSGERSGSLAHNESLYSASFISDDVVLQWLDTVVEVLDVGAGDWNIYATWVGELALLLGNHKLFESRMQYIKLIKDTAVAIIRGQGLYERMPNEMKPLIVANLVQVLTIIVSYHRDIPKDEMLAVIAIFTNTAGYGDFVVSKNCIHGLTMSCYEVPHLMRNVMESVIDKMSKMITQRFLAIHVLQFLASLSRLPALYSNFTQRDYMRIFGVCQAYLRSTQGQSPNPERYLTPEGEKPNSPEDALPDYVYALAHHVVTFWYIAMSSQNRKGLKEYITKILTYWDNRGNQKIEPQGLVTIDMMDRVDADEAIPEKIKPFDHTDGQILIQNRLTGLILITTETSLRTARTIVTIRRSSGVSKRDVHGATTAQITRMGVEGHHLAIVADDIDGLIYGKISIPDPESPLGSHELVVLPSGDDSVLRAIQSLDRVPALDSHKAGVIYIGEGQRDEATILQNVSGSPDYRDFIEDLGTLQRLQGATFNTQGLDRESNLDGDYAVVWNNQVTEMVFHVTTMMPNSDDVQQNTAKKKRHIGNDFVNIVFNNSGARLTYETLYKMFPSAFGYVYIVVTPSARTSFVQARTSLPPRKEDRMYRVCVLSKPDYPNVSPVSEEKVVSGVSLAGCVRNLALNDCVVSLMKSPFGAMAEYPSSWRTRADQLERMMERFRAKRS